MTPAVPITHRLPTRLSALLVLALAGGALLPAAVPASPSRYILEKCDSVLPNGGTDGANFTGPAPFTPGNNCAEPGGALIILQGGPTSSSEGHWNLPMPAPPGGTMESITVTALACNGTRHDPGTTASIIKGAWPISCAAEVRGFQVNSSSGTPGLLSLGCEGTCEQDPFAWAHYFAATEVDPVPPTVDSLRGTLVAGGVIRGHQTLLATAHDDGGGIAGITLRINGSPSTTPKLFDCKTAKANNSSVVGIVATAVTPCPTVAQASWSVDTASPPFHDGTNSVQLCANDFSTIGPANETCSEKGFKVDNSCAESPIGGGETLTAAFKRTERQRVTVPYGHPVKLAGRLTDANGQPLAGATICISARTLAGDAAKLPLLAIGTDAHGHYSYVLPPGPNRAIVIAYRQDARQIERHLRYFARARPSLRFFPKRLHNGERVHFRGNLPGPGRRGRVVVLQASVFGAQRWITFRKATTDRLGIFRATYRFGSTARTTAYRFRAVVPHQAGYPWVQGHSKPIRVLVTR